MIQTKSNALKAFTVWISHCRAHSIVHSVVSWKKVLRTAVNNNWCLLIERNKFRFCLSSCGFLQFFCRSQKKQFPLTLHCRVYSSMMNNVYHFDFFFVKSFFQEHFQGTETHLCKAVCHLWVIGLLIREKKVKLLNLKKSKLIFCCLKRLMKVDPIDIWNKKKIRRRRKSSFKQKFRSDTLSLFKKQNVKPSGERYSFLKTMPVHIIT